jgi:asparagine synthase (glutamine-hydrolysing)
MGGICGFVGLSDKSIVKRMSEKMRHRGFREDFFVDKNVSLCSRSFNEGGLGKNEDNSIWVVFDGEIFNTLNLRCALESNGHSLSSPNPPELIAHLYEDQGGLAVDKLRGSFSFAIWDAKRKSLLLARDREGEKTIFYAFADGIIYFASEIKALLCCKLMEKRLNPSGLDYYFSWGHVPAPETLFYGIKKLPPAHILWYKNNKIFLHKYWDLDFSKIEWSVDEDEWCKQIYNMLADSILVRLTDGPFGILLGGLDSSAMAALIRRMTNEQLKSFTINFENEKFNEPYARYVAELLGIDAYEETLYAKDFMRIIPKLVQIFDDLRIDLLITIPTFLALETARTKVKTIFTADGADCVFWSWGWDSSREKTSRLTPIISSLRKQKRYLVSISEAHNLTSKVFKTFEYSLKARLLSAHLPPDLRSLYGDQYFHEDELQELLGRHCFVNLYSPFLECVKYSTNDIGRKINRMRLINKKFEVIGGWGVERLGSMCPFFGLRLRTPFEDHELKELAARIPPLLKQPDELSDKYIFRKTLVKYSLLPKEVVKQRKFGFGWGLHDLASEWFSGELKEYITQTITEGIKIVKPVLKEKAVIKYLRRGQPLKILSLLSFILWYEHYFVVED